MMFCGDDEMCVIMGGGLMTFVVICKQGWCSSVDVEVVWRGGGGEGGGLMTFVVICKQGWCSAVDVEVVWRGGGGEGGANHVRCCLQTKMMFLGGCWNSLLLANKDDVLRWMLKFVVACKQRWCSLVAVLSWDANRKNKRVGTEMEKIRIYSKCHDVCDFCTKMFHEKQTTPSNCECKGKSFFPTQWELKHLSTNNKIFIPMFYNDEWPQNPQNRPLTDRNHQKSDVCRHLHF